jgi:hypothetical protein
MRPGFWSEQTKRFLQSHGRQDLIDRGDQFAERIAALFPVVDKRIHQWLAKGCLYDGKAGTDFLTSSTAINDLEEFVNVKLRNEIDVLEAFLNTFEDHDQSEIYDYSDGMTPSESVSLTQPLMMRSHSRLKP